MSVRFVCEGNTVEENHIKMMAVAAAQKNREMFAIKKSYSIEVSATQYIELLRDHHQSGRTVDLTCL